VVFTGHEADADVVADVVAVNVFFLPIALTPP